MLDKQITDYNLVFIPSTTLDCSLFWLVFGGFM